MNLDGFRLTLRAPVRYVVLVCTDKLFLFGIDRNNRVASSHASCSLLVDELEFSITVWMTSLTSHIERRINSFIFFFIINQKRIENEEVQSYPDTRRTA